MMIVVLTSEEDKPNFGIGDYGDIVIYDKHAKKGNIHGFTGFRQHDEISMILNTKTATLCIQKNSDDKLMLIENMTMEKGIRYKMAVSLRCESSIVALIDFKCNLT